MYSHDDRLRAVRLYIKLGKRVRMTIRQLGYPTKNSLKSWHRGRRQLLWPLGVNYLGRSEAGIEAFLFRRQPTFR